MIGHKFRVTNDKRPLRFQKWCSSVAKLFLGGLGPQTARGVYLEDLGLVVIAVEHAIQTLVCEVELCGHTAGSTTGPSHATTTTHPNMVRGRETTLTVRRSSPYGYPMMLLGAIGLLGKHGDHLPLKRAKHP